jgi:hypothetical protein
MECCSSPPLSQIRPRQPQVSPAKNDIKHPHARAIHQQPVWINSAGLGRQRCQCRYVVMVSTAASFSRVSAPIKAITVLELQDQAQRMLICPGSFCRHRIETFTWKSAAF